jgi:putative RNA 2'-phosphotransferase
MTDDLTATSRFLSYVLRHNPAAIGLTLQDGGWVDVDSLLAAMARHRRPIDRRTLERLVAGTDKQRFQRDGDRIRAAQGHSLPVDLHLDPVTPPAVLYHGTADRFLTDIMANGLVPGRRNHVHLSADPRTATAVGARHGRPVVLAIDAAGMHHDGHVFHHAANGVWLTTHIPPQWINRMQNRSGE